MSKVCPIWLPIGIQMGHPKPYNKDLLTRSRKLSISFSFAEGALVQGKPKSKSGNGTLRYIVVDYSQLQSYKNEKFTISNQQSAISNQQSAISNQQSAISNQQIHKP